MLEAFCGAIAVIICALKASGFTPAHLIGGFVGGLIRAIITKTGNRWAKLFSGAIGALLAASLAPVVVAFVGTAVPASSVSFCVGLVGMSLCEGLIGIGRDYSRHPGKLRADIRDILLRILGAKKDSE